MAENISSQKYDSLKVEVEIENWSQLREAINTDLDVIMLDNWDLSDISEAITFIRDNSDYIKIEISGGISKSNLREYAEQGADYISIGYISAATSKILQTEWKGYAHENFKFIWAKPKNASHVYVREKHKYRRSRT